MTQNDEDDVAPFDAAFPIGRRIISRPVQQIAVADVLGPAAAQDPAKQAAGVVARQIARTRTDVHVNQPAQLERNTLDGIFTMRAASSTARVRSMRGLPA